MPPPRQFCCRSSLAFLALLVLAPSFLFAGGGPFNTLVVVNTNSAASVELGEYYAAAHGIPAHQLCRLGLATNLVSITSNEFHSLLLNPIRNYIAAQSLVGQIDFLVLCHDFPTRVRHVEGVTAALFYGYQNAPGTYDPPSGTCKLPDDTSNAYYRAERAFRSADGWNATNGFVAFHLIASNLPAAKLVADRGAAAQSTFPAAASYLYFYGNAPRGVREQLFENAQFSCASLPGVPAGCTIGPSYTEMSGKTNVIGFQDGFAGIPAGVRTNNTWLPGAFADHMTSYSGRIANFTNATDHSTVLDWMSIGATASYGTVAEPCNYLAKYPDPLMGFYYARGFTVGEAYAMAVKAPYQGLFAGDPLAAPFAAPPVLSVTSHLPDQIVTGTVPVQVSAGAHANGVPAAALDFYLDGRFQANLATLGPTRGNRLSVVVGTRTNTATVGPGDSLFDAVENLAAAINSDPAQIVFASATGDRLELIYKQFNSNGDNAPVSASVSTGTADALTLGVGLAATRLQPAPYPAREYVQLVAAAGGANAGDTLTCILTLTNGLVVTNTLVAEQGETAANLLERLRTAIHGAPDLQGADGVRYDRLSSSPNSFGVLLARTSGPDGWGILVNYFVTAVSNSSGLATNSNFSSRMDDNPNDIRPRAAILFHVTPTNGILSTTAALDTTGLADGVHTLDFIARDGSGVAAQSRLTLPLVVCNSSAQLSILGTNDAPVANGEEPDLAKGTDFGTAPWGQARTNRFAIHNNGAAPLVISGWTTNGPGAAAFQVLDVPAVVAAGSSSNFLVVFTPNPAGVFQATLAFNGEAIVPQTNILFSGTGAPRDQAIDFPAIPDQLATNLIFLSAAATSDLPVSFAIAEGPAQIDDFTNLTFIGAGIVSIVATQTGDANWNSAAPVTNTFAVFGTYLFTVNSDHGTADPPVGVYTQWHGTVLSPSVALPSAAGGTQFVGTGWMLINHEPATGPGTNFTLALTNDATLTWLWTTNFWLETTAGPNGTVAAADGWLPAGEITRLTAIPDDYYHLLSWSGSVSGSDNPLDLLMDSPKSVLANFAPNLATNNTPEWWLAQFDWTNNFDAAALADAEPDGFFTWQEYIADTDPKDSDSYPRVASIDSGGPHPVVAWPASTGRLYQIHWCDDLFFSLWTTQQLTLGANAWSDTNSPLASNRYYRIAPQLP